MNQEKIGKLIAKLRKNKGLTQRELGEMVGVGFRAVSKWETGLTSPDISIINDLSRILGISADELLKGEVNDNIHPTKAKTKSRGIIYIAIVLVVIILSILSVIINRNKTYIYELGVGEQGYYVEGEMIFKNNNISLKINKIGFEDKEFIKTTIKNYQYEISCKNTLIIGYGYVAAHQALPAKTTIEKLYDKFKINYTGNTIIKRKTIIKEGLNLKITFIDEKNNEIIKNIKIKLSSQK